MTDRRSPIMVGIAAFFVLVGICLAIVALLPTSYFAEFINRLGGEHAPEKLRYLPAGRVAAWILTLILFTAAGFLYRRADYLRGLCEGFNDWVDSLPEKQTIIGLILISFLGLFFEVMLIRWIGTQVRLLAYFKNFVLISCFLGMGVGFAMAGRRFSLVPIILPLLSVYALIVALGGRFGLFRIVRSPQLADLHIWGAYQDGRLILWLIFYGTILGFFLVNVILFLPFGQLTGRLMDRLNAPIKAYTVNIIGSLLGIWAFSIFSFWRSPPVVWFALGVLGMLWFLRGRRFLWVSGWVLLVVLILVMWVFREQNAYWSPYQKVNFASAADSPEDSRGLPGDCGYFLKVNEDFHQRALNLKPEYVAGYEHKYPYLDELAEGYARPYRFIRENPERVLVVGAGTGNDVAAALRQGAQHVDAVEIDPVIASLGRQYHPEKPYDSPKVNLVVDDARAFIKYSDNKYDAIVYGFLDSHSLLSSMSSVRIDNFVYTVEGFAEARDRLKPHGIVAVNFAATREFIVQRMFKMLRDAFGEDPLVFPSGYENGYLFLAGGGVAHITLPTDIEVIEVVPDDTPVAIDDWPFLYIRERGIPMPYIWMVILACVTASLMILTVFPEAKKINLHFFFLGAAFLLIEVKAIVELAIVYGTTWLINSVVISVILFLILISNLIVSKNIFKSLTIPYILLFVTILIGYFIPLSLVISDKWVVRYVLSSLLLLMPVLFAGIIFATSLKRTERTSAAFGSNLLGAMVGGFCEYSSLTIGIRSLYLVAFGLYVLSMLTLKRSK